MLCHDCAGPGVVIFLLSGYAWVWAALARFSLFSVNKCAIVSSGPVFVTTVITCVDFVQRECENMSHPHSNNASSLSDSMLISSTHVYFCSYAVNDQHIIPLWARHHQNTVSASGRRRSITFMAMLNVRSKAHFYYMLLLNYNVPLTFFMFWLSPSEGELSYLCQWTRVSSRNLSACV